MRRVGVLCAAALVALEENVRKLEEDHKNAKLLAGYCLFPVEYNFVTTSQYQPVIHASEFRYCVLCLQFFVILISFWHGRWIEPNYRAKGGYGITSN